MIRTFAGESKPQSEMETSKEYYGKVMSDYRPKNTRRSLRIYCLNEDVDYQWLLKAQKTAGRQPSDERHLPLATGCDKTPVEAGHGYALKSSILPDVGFDKFFLTIAEPDIRRNPGLLGLFAV